MSCLQVLWIALPQTHLWNNLYILDTFPAEFVLSFHLPLLLLKKNIFFTHTYKDRDISPLPHIFCLATGWERGPTDFSEGWEVQWYSWMSDVVCTWNGQVNLHSQYTHTHLSPESHTPFTYPFLVPHPTPLSVTHPLSSLALISSPTLLPWPLAPMRYAWRCNIPKPNREIRLSIVH